MRESTTTAVNMQVSVYSVCALPPGHRSVRYFTLAVERHDTRRWAVRYRLAGTWRSAVGQWDDKPAGRGSEASGRRWYARHAFPLQEAIERAKRAAASLNIKGATIADVLTAGR